MGRFNSMTALRTSLHLVLWLAMIVGLWAARVCCAQTPPAPEVVSLATRDGVQLKITYFASTRSKGSAQAKQVAPVVLLHDYKETRNVLAPFAGRLQAPGENEPDRPSFAVITVDLRAHGDSTKQLRPDGFQIDLDAARLNKNGMLAMASLDMEAVRGFLVVKNDAGELNLNKLCLLGAGMGAGVAANWAAQDWAAPPLAVGKQGQDVKVLVLVSPRWSFKGLSMHGPMQFPLLKQSVAWMLIYGKEDARVKADVNRIEKLLEPFHRRAADAATGQPPRLVVIDWPSKLQGTTLLTQVGAPIGDQVIRFLVENAALKELPWSTRLDRLP
jgi:pimeloyl-ACP methyl ester carboxylesterase